MKKLLLTAFLTVTAVAAQADDNLIRHPLAAGGEAGEFRIIAKKPEHFNRKPSECASVKFDHDKNNLYFTVLMDDNDVISEALKDQDMLRNFGDCIQIFIKSETETFVWEFQIAPNGKKTCFFHPGPGRMLYPQPNFKAPEFSVKNSFYKGKWEMTVKLPLSIFKAKGFKFTKEEKWTAVIVRYNYSRLHTEREVSSYPQTLANTANPDFYAELILK